MVYYYILNNKHNISVNQLQLFSEASCIKLDLKISNMPITILAVYRSPQTNINIFLSELSTIMTSGPIQKNFVWIGGINIDVLRSLLHTAAVAVGGVGSGYGKMSPDTILLLLLQCVASFWEKNTSLITDNYLNILSPNVFSSQI